MKFSICVAASRAQTLGDTIASIRVQTYPDWELIVVGQGEDSAVRTVATAAAHRDTRVRYEHIDLRGTSRARNAAIQRAQGEIIVLLDDDCEAAPDWLSILAACFAADPTIGLVGGSVIAPPPPGRWPRRCPEVRPTRATYDPRLHGSAPPAGWDWIGGNVAIRREILASVGRLDEYLGPGTPFPSGEDTDLKLRLQSLGIRMQTDPDVIVIHVNGWRTGLSVLLQHQRNYARGNGAMAGKLTLQGDIRGVEWLRAMRQFAPRRPWSFLLGLRRYLLFRAAYRECVQRFGVDDQGLLVPRADPVAPSPMEVST